MAQEALRPFESSRGFAGTQIAGQGDGDAVGRGGNFIVSM